MSNCTACRKGLYSSKKCQECNKLYCKSCLSSKFCTVCKILCTRPANQEDLMKLRPRELKTYLIRHNYALNDCLEKEELVVQFLKYADSESKKPGIFMRMLNSLAPSSLNISNGDHKRPMYSKKPFPSTSSNPTGSHQPHGSAYYMFGGAHNPRYSRAPPPRPPPPHPSATTADENPSTIEMNSFLSARFELDTSGSEENIAQDTTSGPQPDTSLAGEQTESPAHPQDGGGARARAKPPDLSLLTNVDDVKCLSVKQLKEILYINRVDYKGCVEKDELVRKVVPLWEQTQVKEGAQNNSIGSSVESNSDYVTQSLDDLCKVCMDAPLNCVLLECGHIVSCIDCGKKLAECPICRQYITRVVHTFKA